MWGRVGGDREFPCLPHPTPNTDKSLVPAGPGQEGRTKAGQRLHSSSYDPFTLVSNLWWKREGKRNTESWGGLVGGLPKQARVAGSKLVILELVMVLVWNEQAPGSESYTWTK